MKKAIKKDKMLFGDVKWEKIQLIRCDDAYSIEDIDKVGKKIIKKGYVPFIVPYNNLTGKGFMVANVFTEFVNSYNYSTDYNSCNDNNLSSSSDSSCSMD
jgi:hypothetical protein